MATANAVTKIHPKEKEQRVTSGIWRETAQNILRNRSAVIGMVIIGLILLVALFAPALATHDPLQSMIGQPGHTNIGPLPRKTPCIHAFGCHVEEPQHFMGLDLNARDMFSRIVYGAQESLKVGFLAVTASIIFGSLLGLIAGFTRGAAQADEVEFFGRILPMGRWRPLWCIGFPPVAVWDSHPVARYLVSVVFVSGLIPGFIIMTSGLTFMSFIIALISIWVPAVILAFLINYTEETIMRIMDVLLAFPSLLLAIAIVTVLGPGLQNALLAIAIVAIPVYARLARASVLSIKEMEYVTAVNALGAKPLRVLFRHVLPNAVTPLIVQGTLGIGTAILDAAALSFIGLGAQPPKAEWGAMLSEARNYVFTSPHLVFFPGLAIMITVLGFNLLGDGMRDALDPRLNRN